MKEVYRYLTAVLLFFALTATAYAGQMDTTITPPTSPGQMDTTVVPPPDSPGQMDTTSPTDTTGNAATTEALTELAIIVSQSMLLPF